MKPNDPMNEFEADVRQTARHLNSLDFSHESQQREAVRERLMDQLYSQSLHRTKIGGKRRHRAV